MGGIRKIMVLWQAVFLAASPPNLNRLVQRLRRQNSLEVTIPPATQATINKDLTVNIQKNIELVAGCGKTIENPSHALIQSRNDVAIEAN